MKKDEKPVKIKRVLFEAYKNKTSPDKGGRMLWVLLGADKDDVIDAAIPLPISGGCGTSSAVSSAAMTKAFRQLVDTGKKFKGFMAVPGIGSDIPSWKNYYVEQPHHQRATIGQWRYYTHISSYYINLFGVPFVGRATQQKRIINTLEIVD